MEKKDFFDANGDQIHIGMRVAYIDHYLQETAWIGEVISFTSIKVRIKPISKKAYPGVTTKYPDRISIIN